MMELIHELIIIAESFSNHYIKWDVENESSCYEIGVGGNRKLISVI